MRIILSLQGQFSSKARLFGLATCLIAVTACGSGSGEAGSSDGSATTAEVAETSAASALNSLSDEEVAAGWELLFDGESMQGWRNFKQESIGGWEVSEGVMFTTGGGGDIVTERQFGDFELELEWRIESGGNSGIFFWVTEDEALDRMWQSGPEYQIIDDHNYSIDLLDNQKTAALADIFPADLETEQIAEQWNSAKVRVENGNVEHWYNGELVLEYTIGSDEWNERVEASKFDASYFGASRTGLIGLQDHGDPVYFRSIRIREL